MNVLMYIFSMIYLIGTIIGHYVGAIGDNAYYICMGLWGVMFILNTISGDIHGRW